MVSSKTLACVLATAMLASCERPGFPPAGATFAGVAHPSGGSGPHHSVHFPKDHTKGHAPTDRPFAGHHGHGAHSAGVPASVMPPFPTDAPTPPAPEVSSDPEVSGFAKRHQHPAAFSGTPPSGIPTPAGMPFAGAPAHGPHGQHGPPEHSRPAGAHPSGPPPSDLPSAGAQPTDLPSAITPPMASDTAAAPVASDADADASPSPTDDGFAKRSEGPEGPIAPGMPIATAPAHHHVKGFPTMGAGWKHGMKPSGHHKPTGFVTMTRA